MKRITSMDSRIQTRKIQRYKAQTTAIEFPQYTEGRSVASASSSRPVDIASQANSFSVGPPMDPESSRSVGSPMSLISREPSHEETAEASRPRKRIKAKGKRGQYSPKNTLFLEWWQTFHSQQGAVVYSKHPDHPDLVDEFEQIFARYEQDESMQEDITAWRNIFRDKKTNAITPLLKKYGWQTESKQLPKSRGETRYLRWTSTTNFADRPRPL